MSATITVNSFAPETVIIGTQTWMKRNYDFGGYYYSGDITKVNGYGKLYTWAQATSISLPGWHLPTKTEFDTLVTYLGGSSVAGNKMKEAGTSHWLTSSGADNSSGFTAVGAGSKNYNNDTCGFLDNYTFFWTATEYDAVNSYCIMLAYDNGVCTSISSGIKSEGFSVRLIKD